MTQEDIRLYARKDEHDEIQFMLESHSVVLNRLRELEAGLHALERTREESTRTRFIQFCRTAVASVVSSERRRTGGSLLPSPRFERQHRYFSRLYSNAVRSDHQPRRERRILTDVSQSTEVDFWAGIPRVVTNIAQGVLKRGGIPVFVHEGSLWTFQWGEVRPEPVAPQEGDCFLMADSGWNRAAEMKDIMSRISANEGFNVILHYDMLPIIYPSFFPRSFKEVFRNWYENVVLQSDAVVAISASVANELVDDVRRSGVAYNPAMRIGWQHLGADFRSDKQAEASKAIVDLTRDGRPMFLCVSTLEPRKGYGVVLDAMDSLWSNGADILLIIIGRYGWNSLATANRIHTHYEFGRRLHWFQSASDGDLELLYSKARSLVYASVAEGFGLPIVEAARHGLNTIASDIPVFREVGSEAVSFFPVGNSVALAREIGRAAEEPKLHVEPLGLTWDRVSAELVNLLDSGSYQLGSLRDLVGR